MKGLYLTYKTILIDATYTLAVMFLVYLIGSFISGRIASYITLPGNIIGMAILYLLLEVKLISYQRIKTTADFLLKHLSLFFIPFGVSILKYYGLLKGNTLYFLLILCVSTLVALSLSSLAIERLGGHNKHV